MTITIKNYYFTISNQKYWYLSYSDAEFAFLQKTAGFLTSPSAARAFINCQKTELNIKQGEI